MLKALLVVMMVLLVGGFGAVAWVSLRPVTPDGQVDAPPPPPARVTVLAATRTIQAGNLLKLDDIGKVDLPAAGLPAGTRPDTTAARSELVGAMVRQTMTENQPLLSSDVLRPSDGGFLAAVLAPGNRAVSVAVDAVSGTAGLIWPGDRVDLILTQVSDEQATPAGHRTFGETVLRDVRVIAVDQQLARGANPDSPQGANQNNRTVTLEVLPEAAERVAVAVRLGRVALVVRAARGQGPEPDAPAAGQTTILPALVQAAPPPAPALPAAGAAPPVTWGQDVSPALNQHRSNNAGATVRVFQGSAGDKEFKFE